jgi:signal transduction histidine kinase
VRIAHTFPSRVGLAVLGLSLLLVAVSASSANATEPKRILFVNSFAAGTSPFAPFNSAFREHMLRAWPAQVAFYEVSLDGWRPGNKENEDALVQVMRSRFADLPMDLVLARGQRAGQFYFRRRDELFPNAPLMVTGDEASLPSAKLRPGDSFVANTVPSVQVVTGLLRLLPETSTIAVVFGKSAPEQYWVNRLKDEFAPLAGRVKFVWLDQLSLPAMRQHVATLAPGAVVLFGVLYIDAAGVPYLENYALSELRAASSVPVFSFYESELGLGTVGGALLGNVESAAVAAKIASRMLRGEWTNDDRVTRLSLTAPRFDWRELKRWNVDEANLPPGSEVLFRPPTMWEEHKRIVLAGLAIVVVQTGLILALLAQRARRRRAEGESSALSGRLLTVHEDERRRLARELHDDVTQRLARLAIDAARLESTQTLPRSTHRSTVHSDLVRLSDDVHALSYRLHPSILDDLGLEEALKAECEHVARQGDVRVDVDVQTVPSKLPQDVALCIFRVAQEALRNVIRHAHASVATVTLAMKNGGLNLEVKDNGHGFDLGERVDHPSLGHVSMEERIRLVRGRLQIRSTAGQGTTISAWVPLASTAEVGGA